MRVVSILLALFLTLPGFMARAADVPGSKDPPFLKRYQGSEIIVYRTKTFDQYHAVNKNDQGGANPLQKWDVIEGAITRIIYRVPEGHSPLELLRNYQAALKEAGFTENFDFSPCAATSTQFVQDFYYQGAGQTEDYPFYPDQVCYLREQGSQQGQDVTVSILFSTDSKPYQFRPKDGPGADIKVGEILVGVDVVVSKPVEIKMIKVTAADMADALASKGSVDLYGILFDTDKSDIKPESTDTLDQIASLLKIDRGLKLEVSGHTDNTGDKAHNQKLSEQRATAVVDTLEKKYGIDAARLVAKGYGDTMPVAPNDTDANKAKNRRVELKKIA